jgi:Mg-chelatase subunit ChlD
MNGIACPHCNQLNPDSQKSCERCGQSLLWSTLGNRGACKTCIPRPVLYAALGVLLGLGFARWTPRPADAPPPLLVSKNVPRIDVVFAIDATGSMADEIEVVKDKVGKMMAEIQAAKPQPDVRFGLVAYRDYGDEYVSKAYPLTSNLGAIQSSLQEIYASGGGDTPEAVAAGLRCAVDEINWDQDPNATRMLFLIGDAGPHQQEDYRSAVKAARARGIQINTWGCSGLQDFGSGSFEEIAALGGGQFQFLTYQQEVVRQDGSKARLVFQGSRTYEVKHDTDWKEGAAEITAKSEVADEAVAAPGAAGGASYKNHAYMPSSDKLENNLDTALVRQVQAEARRKGCAY